MIERYEAETETAADRDPTPLRQALHATSSLSETSGRRGFLRGIREFIEALATISDYSLTAFPKEDRDYLGVVAERVILAIERRIESQRDSSAVQIELAAAVYDIRRLLEEAARWWNHASPPRG